MSTDLHITGKVAQFGRGIIGDVSKKLMEQFAANLNTMLDTDPVDDAAAASSESRATAGNGDQTGRARRAGTAGDGASSGAPQVRKIEGPATEPVDLAGVAGPAVLKRVLPLVAGLVLLLLVLRRRR